MADAKALLLIDDQKAKIMELDLFVKELVRADNQVDHTALQLVDDLFLLGRGLVARD